MTVQERIKQLGKRMSPFIYATTKMASTVFAYHWIIHKLVISIRLMRKRWIECLESFVNYITSIMTKGRIGVIVVTAVK